MKTLYIHGLDSNPNPLKLDIIQKYSQVEALHINYRTEKDPYEKLSHEIASKNITRIIGSSLVGFLGFWLAEEHKLPCLLFNPALGMRDINISVNRHYYQCPKRIIVLGETDEIWVIFYKKKSSKANLSWSEAVDESLCFGWINSVKKPIDGEKYRQYFSKRKANSTWSKINKDKVDYLTAKNLMQAAGNKTIEIAKQNGSWSILDEVEALVIPENLMKEFQKREGALA